MELAKSLFKARGKSSALYISPSVQNNTLIATFVGIIATTASTSLFRTEAHALKGAVVASIDGEAAKPARRVDGHAL